MNKHKSNCSTMGLETSIEKAYTSQLKEKHKVKLRRMIAQYNQGGFDEIVKILRELKEETK